MRVLVAFSDPAANEVVSLGITGQYKIDVQSASDPDELAAILVGVRSVPFDVIFCDHPNRSNLVGSMLHRSNIKIPLVIFGTPEEVSSAKNVAPKIAGSPQVITWITWAIWLHQIRPLLEALAGPEYVVLSRKPDTEFHPIRLGMLLVAGPLPADIYIRLSDAKYLRIFRTGDVFDELDYDRYGHQKMLLNFYLRRDGLYPTVARLTDMIQERLSGGLTAEEATELSEQTHEVVQRVIRHWYPAPEVNDLIKANLNLTLQAIGKNPRLKDVLKRVTGRPKTYLTVHSVALGQIACTIANAVGWGSKTTFSKLNFAAFLHDVSVDDDETIAKVNDAAGLEMIRKTKGEDTLARYLSHGSRAAELSHQFHEVPPDVDLILSQHHEKPDGSGFPRHLNHQHIAPLSALFIMAHDMVQQIHTYGNRFSYSDFIRARYSLYSVGYFKKVLQAIEKLR
ncbi:MAG: hypothetical protein RJB38_2036 [Pseudomonadota bacterium]|jgi:hypothetical protein